MTSQRDDQTLVALPALFASTLELGLMRRI